MLKSILPWYRRKNEQSSSLVTIRRSAGLHRANKWTHLRSVSSSTPNIAPALESEDGASHVSWFSTDIAPTPEGSASHRKSLARGSMWWVRGTMWCPAGQHINPHHLLKCFHDGHLLTKIRPVHKVENIKEVSNPFKR